MKIITFASCIHPSSISLLGRTYALQCYPDLRVVSWSPTYCHLSSNDNTVAESALEDCTPFHEHGPLLLSIGYLIASAIFFPLGWGQLKETVWVQIFSFCILAALLIVFFGEFIYRGLDYTLPLVGEDMTQLAGVVLFNYAYTITVPSWLGEKKVGFPISLLLPHL
jgi:hypothetical protein